MEVERTTARVHGPERDRRLEALRGPSRDPPGCPAFVAVDVDGDPEEVGVEVEVSADREQEDAKGELHA